MESKGFIKVSSNDLITIVHYIESEEGLSFLTLNSSNKYTNIKVNENISIAFGMKSDDFQPAIASIVEDKELVKNVYDILTDLKHNHFKEYDENIILVNVKLG